MFSRKTLEERDACRLGSMLLAATKWYYRALNVLLTILVSGFLFYMFISHPDSLPNAGWALCGSACIVVIVIAFLISIFIYPLLREVGRLRKEIEGLKARIPSMENA